MEHHIELFARSPTKDYKFLLANIPAKYFKGFNELDKEEKEFVPFEKVKSNRSIRKKHRKKQFAGVCTATLSYIQSLEELLLLVMEKKVGGCAHGTSMYFDFHPPQQMYDMAAEDQMLSTELRYACSQMQRPDNMTDEDKCVMQYFIHKQIQAVDPQLCASLQLFAHKEAVAADPWTRQQRSFPPVPAPLFTVPIATSMKQLSGGGIVCQNSMLTASPSIMCPCCNSQAPCQIIAPQLDMHCPECNPGHIIQPPPPPPPPPQQDNSSSTMPPPLPPPPLLPCCTDIAHQMAALPTADPITVYSACSRLCEASSSMERCPVSVTAASGACHSAENSSCCSSMSPPSLYAKPSVSGQPAMNDSSSSTRVADVSDSYQSAMEDLLLEGCDSPTESFRGFDTGLWNDKVPMDIDDIDVAQLAF